MSRYQITGYFWFNFEGFCRKGMLFYQQIFSVGKNEKVNYHKREKTSRTQDDEMLLGHHVYKPDLTHCEKSSLKPRLKILEEYHFFHSAAMASSSCNLTTSQTSIVTS